MNKEGFISVTIKGKTIDGSLSPKDIDINETKEILTDVETLLFPTKLEKEDRPKVSYEVQEGSVRNIFFVPIAKAIMFTALMSEVGKQGTTELLEPQAAAIIDKWQQRSYKIGYEYSITSSTQSDISFLNINRESKFIAPQTDWVNTSLYLYGEIYEEGGLSKSNLHIATDRYGRLTVSATKEQLTEGPNKLYNVYGLWVKGKQNVSNSSLKDLSLIDFITYDQNYDQIVLNTLIEKASANWKKIKNKDAWLADVRGGNDE
jgi:hypothetical protein